MSIVELAVQPSKYDCNITSACCCDSEDGRKGNEVNEGKVEMRLIGADGSGKRQVRRGLLSGD